MLRRRLALWAASIAAIHTAAASAVPFHELFLRQSQQTQTSSTCAPNFNRCKNPDFPDYFCCGASDTCIALAANTTVLCCPGGADCLRIQPVPCNLQLQDGKLNPDAVIKTTALDGTLGRCGAQCCPFGYSCVDRLCVRDRNQNTAPSETGKGKPTATTTKGGANPTSTGAGNPTADPTGGSSDTPSDNNNNDSNTTPVAAIAGGATAAGVIIIGAAVLAFIFFRKRNKDSDGEKPNRPGGNSPPKLSRSTSSFGNLISNPIVADNSFRTDFARGPGPRTPPERAPPEDPDSVTGALIDSSVNSPEAGLGGGAGAGGGMQAVPLAAALAGHQQQQGQYGNAGGAGNAYGGYGNLDPAPGAGPGASRGPGGAGAGAGQNAYLRMPFSPSDPNDIDDEIYHGGGPAGLGGYLPQTPRQQQFPRTAQQPQQPQVRDREPSSVSINVFADPNITPDRTPETHADEYEDVAVRDTRVGGPGNGPGGNNRYTHMTTFTQMLDKADLGGMARGESFLDAYGVNDGDDTQGNGNGNGRGNGGLAPPRPRR